VAVSLYPLPQGDVEAVITTCFTRLDNEAIGSATTELDHRLVHEEALSPHLERERERERERESSVS
jgi:hypothetical protein